MATIRLELSIEITDKQEDCLSKHGAPQRLLGEWISDMVRHRGLNVLSYKSFLERTSSEWINKLKHYDPVVKYEDYDYRR
ncbi:MAG: hypothetical protein ACW987_18365 [Candidatus Thorarchaeota archaeon]|jgi:hypothetical protein